MSLAVNYARVRWISLGEVHPLTNAFTSNELAGMSRSLDQLISALGGETAVADLLGVGPSAVSNWKARGLPKARWVDFVILGREVGVRPIITLDEIRLAAAAIDNAWSEPA